MRHKKQHANEATRPEPEPNALRYLGGAGTYVHNVGGYWVAPDFVESQDTKNTRFIGDGQGEVTKFVAARLAEHTYFNLLYVAPASTAPTTQPSVGNDEKAAVTEPSS